MAEAAGAHARFTALELAAAEHLIHLSESSSSAAAFGPASAASSSSSPRSVNAPAVPRGGGLAAAEDEEEEDEQQEVGGRRRRNKRYRAVAEIYAATAPTLIGARGGTKEKGRTKPAAAGAGKEARK